MSISVVALQRTPRDGALGVQHSVRIATLLLVSKAEQQEKRDTDSRKRKEVVYQV